jgi:uncharacterized protein (DUF488 family)
MLDIYTIGHSTHPLELFVRMLRANGVTRLVDIRSIPRSRFNPQYEQSALIMSMPENHIEYIHMKSLGGLRHPTGASFNLGWRNASFRSYADYMQTAAFKEGIDTLMRYAAEKPTAIMCAEALPWRCHRSLVADALTVRGATVLDIMDQTTTKAHSLTPFAVVDGTHITYPRENADG